MAVSLLPFSVVQVSSLACSGESALSDFTAHSVHMPEAEVLFWRGCYMLQPYFVPGRGFDQYEPAYELGWQAAIHSRRRVSEPGSDFDALELQLRMLWPHRQAASLLDWAQVRGAAHAAWLRAVDARQSAALWPELWSKAEKRRIAHVLRASRQFTRITQIFLVSAQPGMAVDALRRFAQESGRLEHELEALLESGGESGRPSFVDGRTILQWLRQAWEASSLRAASARSWGDVLQCLQLWLERTERAAQESSLPAPVLRLLKHHAMVLRGYAQALRWLGLPSDSDV